jgi:hypothetical protein
LHSRLEVYYILILSPTTGGAEAIASIRPVNPVVVTATSMAYPAYFTPFAAKASIPLAPYGRLRFCVLVRVVIRVSYEGEVQKRFKLLAIDAARNSSLLRFGLIGSLALGGTRCSDLA